MNNYSDDLLKEVQNFFSNAPIRVESITKKSHLEKILHYGGKGNIGESITYVGISWLDEMEDGLDSDNDTAESQKYGSVLWPGTVDGRSSFCDNITPFFGEPGDYSNPYLTLNRGARSGDNNGLVLLLDTELYDTGVSLSFSEGKSVQV